MPRGFPDHPNPEHAHRATFEQGGSCSPSQCQSEHGDTYGVIEAVTEEVERVGVQAHRARDETGYNFYSKHARVDAKRKPKQRASSRQNVIAATCTHRE
jgi:hypothetical protein